MNPHIVQNTQDFPLWNTKDDILKNVLAVLWTHNDSQWGPKQQKTERHYSTEEKVIQVWNDMGVIK